ncbi:type VII secretion protein EssB/YukC [Lysinibacillus pakistanensis]|uniref:type VII secretion protein EssB/YukC n=1 Tax=Lysinibacillus pakistanensis TaxID=759811 RepID=UPI003D29DC35
MSATKIYNFSFGSIKLTRELAQFTIHRNEFSYDRLEEVEQFLRDTRNDAFLSFRSIEENEGHVVMTFHFVEHLKPIVAIKQEAYVVKLAIAQAILLDEIVTKTSSFVSLHPATVYYHPMSTIRYGYRANRQMPREEKYTHLQRYKALILTILTNQPYEKCLEEPEHLTKRANDLVHSILQAQTIEDMQLLLIEAYDFVAYHTVQTQTVERKKWRSRMILGVVLTALLGLVGIGYVKQNANEQQAAAIQSLTADYEEEQLIQEADTLFAAGKFKEAVPLFLALGDSTEEVAKKLVLEDQWQLALDTEPAILETVITALYNEGEEKRLLDLTISEKMPVYTQKLAQEKAIVSYDVAQMSADLPFISDEQTLKRMGQTFVKNGDMAGAREVLNKTQDAELKRTIELTQAESELVVAKEKLTALESENSANKADQLKVQQTKIQELEAKIQGLKGG